MIRQNVNINFLLPGIDAFDLIPQAHKIIECLRPLAEIPQKRRGMIDSGAPNTVYLHPLAMLSCDTVVGIDKLLGGDTAQTNDDLRLDQLDLIIQIPDASLLFIIPGIPVFGRSAFDDIRDIDIIVPRQVDDREHIVQQLSGGTDEGLSLQVLLFTRTLTDEHDIRIGIADAKYNAVPGLAEPAAGAGHTGGLQVFPRGHITSSFFCSIFCGGASRGCMPAVAH